jgi:hypothetical protein
MLRAGQIGLVLMGGGLVMWSVAPSKDCMSARLQHRPDASQLCAGAAGHGGYYTHTLASSRVGTVVRGGFGSIGAHLARAG